MLVEEIRNRMDRRSGGAPWIGAVAVLLRYLYSGCLALSPDRLLGLDIPPSGLFFWFSPSIGAGRRAT